MSYTLIYRRMAESKELPCYVTQTFGFFSVESVQNALDFQPRPSDVIISTFAKCGTTWMQQITHQLRTGGDMDFEEMDDVVPWMELALDKKRDLNAEQKANPRLFKSHLPQSHCPTNCKHIIVCRNPCCAAFSLFMFAKHSSAIPATIPLSDFIKGTWLAYPDIPDPLRPLTVSYFTHLLGWYKHRNDPTVLIVFFEEMKDDPENVVRAVSSFLGFQDEQKIQVALRLSSFAYMKENMLKFDLSAPNLPKAQGHVFPFVRKGSADEALKILPDDLKAAIQAKWEKEVTKLTGYKTYEELRRGVREERPL